MKSLIAWFAGNSVAANLLMLVIIVGGGYAGFKGVDKEAFPSSETNMIHIDMSYLGAGPREVEQQIIVRIEDAIADLPGIFQIRSSARQGGGTVSVEVIEGFDVKDVLNDIKARADAINTFPSNIERPVIYQQINRQALMYFTLHGNVDDALLKATSQQIADDMALLDGVSSVRFRGSKADEMNIEVSEHTLRRYGLSFDQVARAIRNTSLNLPAGSVKTKLGSVQVQTRSQAYTADDFADIVVLSYPNGTQLKLGDIATITDGFAEEDREVTYDGVKAMDFTAFMSDEPDLFGGTQNARDYLESLNQRLPPGLSVTIDYEMKQLFDSRLELLSKNALGGLALVFIILMLFLRPMLAVWVCVGIGTSFAGAIFMLPHIGISLNMLSMFAFIMVLGIVVDDAIVVGESIYSEQQTGHAGVKGSTSGAQRVFKPVVLAVLSTIVFFMPMLDVPMSVEPYTLSIFYVVTFCLIFSLVECLLILPSHLTHLKPEKPARFALTQKLKKIREWFSGSLKRFCEDWYTPHLKRMLNRSVSTIIGFVIAFSIALAIYLGGWIKTSFFPHVPQSFIVANIQLPEGTAYSEALRIANHVEIQAQKLKTHDALLEINNGRRFVTQIKKSASEGNANIFVGLVQPEERDVSAKEVSQVFRELIGPLPEAKEYSLAIGFGGNDPDIALNLSVSTNDLKIQQTAVAEVKRVLAAYPGVINTRSSLESERVEVELALKPHAETLGISLNDIARQVRQGFFGEEVQRIPRGKEDVRVMLNYPREDRTDLDLLNQMRVRSATGAEIPLEAVADIKLVPGFTRIDRVDRKRNITVTAEVTEGTDALAIINALLEDNLTQWQREFIGFELSADGNLRAQAQFGDSLMNNFIMSLVAVYAIMAISFRSYSEPLLILTAVPFGFMGAIIGHTIFGENISMMSFFGFLACAGVVVNDNLVLLDRINRLRESGMDAMEAVLSAGQHRFRAIVLTSITTFVGLMPILSERSSQAQFLQPMVIALAFGVLFASAVTLILVPCLYWEGHKFKLWWKEKWRAISAYFGATFGKTRQISGD